ncbi:glyoxalase/bleomycin resistance/extradiol dioxygenase family protein [Streptomyces sp. NPDC048623]|uniref:glyoxalase/bleomycin resistance/extradiol dioxygenase family protein n=1 Tax=Streptomyces sp. NPDC048623 TaxID=3155761 RepID=UPI00343F3672
MDAPYPRLLVTRFADCFHFYDAVLPPLTGARLAKGAPSGPYANWDRDDRAVLSLFDRTAMAATLGTTALPPAPAPAQDTAVLVFHVPDVDRSFTLCLAHGATPATTPADRPEWGPTLRSAHVRDPEGRLIELQSY